ncbi:hypothetical protein ACJW31_04G073800 [Castanea mollissima]
MGSQTTFCDMLSCSSSSFCFVVLKTSSPKTKTTLRPSSSNFALQTPPPLQVKLTTTDSLKPTYPYFLRRFSRTKTRATFDEKDQSATPLLEQEEQQQPSREVEESVELLKKAAKSRRVAAEEILSAFSVIEKAKIDPSGFLDTLGGSKSPGRTWMLIFTAEKENKGGRYFPITAIQRFDATNISYQRINPKADALQALFLFHQMPPGKNIPLSTIHIDVFFSYNCI